MLGTRLLLFSWNQTDSFSEWSKQREDSTANLTWLWGKVILINIITLIPCIIMYHRANYLSCSQNLEGGSQQWSFSKCWNGSDVHSFQLERLVSNDYWYNYVLLFACMVTLIKLKKSFSVYKVLYLPTFNTVQTSEEDSTKFHLIPFQVLFCIVVPDTMAVHIQYNLSSTIFLWLK